MIFFREKAIKRREEQLNEIRNLMKKREDYKSMNLPVEFANTVSELFESPGTGRPLPGQPNDKAISTMRFHSENS